MKNEYASVFDHYRDAVIMIKDGAVIYANPAAVRSVEAYEGMKVSELFPEVFPDFRGETCSCALNIKGREYCAVVTAVEDVSVVTLYESCGNIRQRLLSLVGTSLKERVTEIKMASGILTPYIENTGDEKMMRYNRIINKAGYILQRMVGNMTYLDSADGVAYDPSYVDLNSMVGDIAGSASAFLSSSSPEIKFVPSKDNVVSYCDRAKLELGIFQLLSNSLKNTPEGGEIVLSVGRIHGSAVIEVADNGSGIREDALGDIWNPDKLCDNAPENGVGMGLAIVQSIARLHGGMAILVSKPGVGTKVSLILPDRTEQANTLSSSNIKYDSGLENLMVQLADVIPFENFSEKFMD